MSNSEIKIGVFPRPLCSNPTLICNRNALNLLLAGAELRYYEDKERTRYRIGEVTAETYHELHLKSFLRTAYAMTRELDLNSEPAIEKLSRFVVVLGQRYEFLYQLVACGRCDLCQEKKLNDFSSRCQWESQTSETKCLFVTFTYKNAQIPWELNIAGRVKTRGIPCAEKYRIWKEEFRKTHSEGEMVIQPMYRLMQSQRGQALPCKHDMQKFFQDFRNHIRRSDNKLLHKERPLRYAWVMEKGTKTGHPHYHALLWNLPLDVDDSTAIGLKYLKQIEDMLKDAWPYGNVYIEVAKSASRYVAKYVGKDTGSGISRMYCSSRGGGIGAKYLEQFKSVAEKNPEMQNIVGVDKWNATPFTHTMGQFATNKLFPPLRYYVSKNDYRQMYECLTFRLTSHIRFAEKFLSENEWNNYATMWYDKLKSLRVTEDKTFLPLPKWEYFQPVEDEDEAVLLTEEQVKMKQKEFEDNFNQKTEYCDKSKQQFTNLTISEIVERLEKVVPNMPTDIDKKLSLRYRHQKAIPVQPITDEFIRSKQLEVHAKQVSRQERETF